MKNKKISLIAGIMLCALTVLFTVLYIALFGEEVSAMPKIPTDISESYAEEAIRFVCENGYMTAEETDGIACFYPEKEVTRGELAVVLAAYLGLDTKRYADASLGFADEKTLSAELAPKIKAVLAAKYMMLNADYTFGAENGITRAETAHIFGALIDGEIAAGKSESFSDFGEVSEYFLKNAKRLVDYEIMIGYEDGTFRPNQILTREELALLIHRLAKSNITIQ